MRTGVIARKIGMTRLFQADGRHVPVTVLQLEDLQVVGFRGNIETRLRKLEEGVADATFLPCDGLNRLVDAVDDKPSDAVVNHFRHRPARPCDDWRATGHGFDHDQAERLQPIDRK